VNETVGAGTAAMHTFTNENVLRSGTPSSWFDYGGMDGPLVSGNIEFNTVERHRMSREGAYYSFVSVAYHTGVGMCMRI
jgi:hypothetical protein